MFLRGTETEPPRAGMTATIRGTTSPSKTGEAGAAIVFGEQGKLARNSGFQPEKKKRLPREASKESWQQQRFCAERRKNDITI